MQEDTIYYPLTNSQKSIMIIDQFNPHNKFVWQANTIKILGNIDYQVLNKAINNVIKHNDIFQCRLTNRYNEIKQYFVPFEESKIEYKDFNFPEGIDSYYQWINQKNNQMMNIFDEKLYYFAIIKFSNTQGGFYFKCHHLICDAWSYVLCIGQIIETYKALVQGKNIQMPAFAYLDYIAKEQKYLQSERYLSDKIYWSNILDKVHDPILIDQGNRNGFAAKRKTISLPLEWQNKIKELCVRFQVSPFIVFMALLAIYFMKTKDRKTVTIGATVLNRMTLKDKRTAGPFFNDLPFVICLDPSLEFDKYIKDLNSQWMELLRHSSYPYINILKDYREKHKVKDKLFDVTITFVTAMYQSEIADTEISIERFFNGEEVSSLCIGIEDLEGRGTYNINYDYAYDLLTEKDISLIHSSLLNMLNNVLENPSQKIKSINMLSAHEQDKIINQFNNKDYDKNENTILEMFSLQARRYPEKTALIFNNEELTYCELDYKSNKLARVLIKKGIQNEEIVGLVVQRSFDLVIGILGILKAGAAYLPIDPTYPADRINYMLEDSRCRFIIHNCEIPRNIDCSEIIKIRLDSDEIEEESIEEISPYPKAEDLAYVIYTSGSTGRPKGVMIEHRALSHFVQAISQEIDLQGKTIISLTTLSFDIFFLETILPILIGMKVVIAGPEEKDNPAILPKLINEYNIDILQVTPSKMSIILLNPSVLNKLSHILIGGEPLTESLLNKIKAVTKAKIYNMYGPTEATIWSSVKRMDNCNQITIGSPLSNTKYYILDKYLQPLPIGIIGEIYIGGDSLARGYLNRSDITAERFLPNPFIPNTRIYKTGDLGRWLENGEIEFMGRNDNQIKIRGFRIETGEIEKYLLDIKDIKQAVVTVISDNDKKILCAYYSGKKLTKTELRKSLASFLPEYMIPNKFVWLESLPLTPNGKIDRQALPQIDEVAIDSVDYCPPRNSIEITLAQTWSKVLNIPLIGINDDFFALGGDSLDVLETLTALLPYEWGLSAQDFYEYPTIKKLAEFINKKSESLR
ncbi:MAG: amino acid adenylation domain-containing protein, partial [Peptococcaceae bacterium]|nr:amino acid adenylation domain-containing protein [Peptococcaceae bacterium]